MTEHAKITKEIIATEARIKILQDEDLSFYLYPYGEIRVYRATGFCGDMARVFVEKLLEKELEDLGRLYARLKEQI